MKREMREKKSPRAWMRGAFGWLFIAAATAIMAWPTTSFAAPVVFAAAGLTAAEIQGAVDEFRSVLGGDNKVGGTFGGGRREINWDGVPDAFAAPNNLPANFFNKNSPRGVVFFTPGLGFQVSGKEGVAPIEFDNLRPNVSRKFAVFSPPRLFTALGSPITEVLFFVPGTAHAATSKGFGSVFTHVDRADSTKIEYYDVNGALLYSAFVPAARGNETLSFLGVAFDAGEEVFLVRITSGDVELGGERERDAERDEHEREGRDLVVMDDFIYGEPQPLP